MARRERNTKSKALMWLQDNCARALSDECLLMPFAPGSHGYCSFSVKRQKTLAHRYVCERFHGRAPTAHHQAAHSCGNKTCVNPHHLRWATRKENEADKVIHGTAPIGEKNGAAKLTESLAKEIRARLGSHREIARAFGVSSSTVGRIKRNQDWGRIDA